MKYLIYVCSNIKKDKDQYISFKCTLNIEISIKVNHIHFIYKANLVVYYRCRSIFFVIFTDNQTQPKIRHLSFA